MADTNLDALTSEDIQNIEKLVIEHAWRADHATQTVWELYTEDGRVIDLRPGTNILGREALRQFGNQRAAQRNRKSRHIQTNLRVYQDSEGRVRGTSYLTLYLNEGDDVGLPIPVLVGGYEDLYKRDTSGAWLFEERRVVWLFADRK